MPHSIFFTREGHAIHGSFETRHLGSAASHGCVRLSPRHAATLFALVRQQGLANTRVVVSNGAPVIAQADRSRTVGPVRLNDRVVFGRRLPDMNDVSDARPPPQALMLPWYGRIELDPNSPIH